MAEWTDIAGLEWTDLASPEWEGDLSVAVPDCPGLTAVSQEVGVQVDCIQNVTGVLTILAVTNEASLQIDCDVNLGALVDTLTVTAKESGVQIDAAVQAAAIPLSLAVLAHTAGAAMIVGQTLIQMTMMLASAKKVKDERGIRAMDIAKRLLDYGFHAPTVYFPLDLPEAMMMEPTETESQETLDRFADTIRTILSEDPELLHNAPHTTPVSRPDEVKAAREPILQWAGHCHRD